VFVLPIRALQTHENLDYLNRAKREIILGKALTLGGVVYMVGGYFVYKEGLSRKDNGSGFSYHKTADLRGLGEELIGLIIVVVGEAMFYVGLSFLITGGIQKGRAERLLNLNMVQFKTPYSNSSINGIGLKMRF
jgi:hypothetical protein